MPPRPRRGLDAKQEQNPQLLIRDTRTIGQRIRDFLSEPRNAAVMLLTEAVATLLAPALADASLAIALIILLYSYTRKTTLPFRLPKRSELYDHNDLVAGTRDKPHKARGIFFLGNEITNNQELWFSNEDMRTHMLIFGSTGSGKTEGLISLSYNALIQGSGFIYVDGKGDNSLFAKIFSMARSMGREDDLLLVNFMTGARDIIGPQVRRLSNTLNPFCRGSSSMLAQLIVSLMDKSAATPDGDMWKGRAIGFVEALMRILVYMRDQGKILLDANVIRNYFSLDRLEAIHVDRIFIRDGDESINLKDVPPNVLEPIDSYMTNLPGYTRSKKGKQVSQVLEQHGFITMQLTRVFTSLADTYGHILRTNLAEVDLRDVVFNRRILVILLPALEKSPAELSNLGKVIIATLKAIMASGLGEEVEGEYRDIIARKPTNSPTPFVCILDEYGYYAVEGFAIVAAQARSLGFSAIFAGQDLPALQKASKEEAASIGGNTNIKIAMKIEDPVETWEFFMKSAGESFVTKVDAFQTQAQSVFNAYMDTRSASAEKRGRIDLLDLKEQREGECHILFKARLIRARIFNANPPPIQYMRLNQHLKVDVPTDQRVQELEKGFTIARELIVQGIITDHIEKSASLATLFETYRREERAEKSLIDTGIAALMCCQSLEETAEIVASGEGATAVSLVEEPASTQLNLFLKVNLFPIVAQVVPANQIARFRSSLLNKSEVQRLLIACERFAGRTEQKASMVVMTLMQDMEGGTQYPPVTEIQMARSTCVQLIEGLVEGLRGMK